MLDTCLLDCCVTICEGIFAVSPVHEMSVYCGSLGSFLFHTPSQTASYPLVYLKFVFHFYVDYFFLKLNTTTCQ